MDLRKFINMIRYRILYNVIEINKPMIKLRMALYLIELAA